jgi:hypothetical protein
MSSPYLYIQLHNAQQDPLYMELHTGKLYWTLPSEAHLQYIRYLSHFADSGQQYYENLESGEVSWVLPTEFMNATVRALANSIQVENRAYSENMIDTKYFEDLTIQQMISLDKYLAQKEQQKSEEWTPEEAPVAATTGATTAAVNSFLSGHHNFSDDEEEDNNNDDDDDDDDSKSARSSLTTSSLGSQRSMGPRKSIKQNIIKVCYSLSDKAYASIILSLFIARVVVVFIRVDTCKSWLRFRIEIGKSGSLQ